MENIHFKHLAGGLKIPKVDGDSFGVYAAEEAVISPSQTKLVKTSTVFDVPVGYLLMVLPEQSVSEKTTLRFANSIAFVRSNEKNELNILLENVTPLGIRKNVAPEYYCLDGTHVTEDYSHGYLPVGSVLVKKGDCIGRAFLVKIENFALSRTTKKAQEQTNEEKGQ